MRYDLECGHCGYQFVLDVGALPRTVKCTVCGGVLTLAVPIPIDPPPVPPAPKPPPPKPPRPRRPVPPVSDADEPDEPLARPLAEPWPLVRTWLDAERVITGLGLSLYFVFLVMDLFVVPGERTAEAVFVRALVVLAAALLLPAIFHLGSQIILASTPAAHGGRVAHISAGLFVLALILTIFGVIAREPGAVALAVAVAFVSFGFWLAFLGRLGRRLGDDELTDAARAYRVWFPFGVVVFAALLMCAVMAATAPSPPLVWIGRAAAGVVGLVLLRLYAALLRLAVDAIDRRAPAAPRR